MTFTVSKLGNLEAVNVSNYLCKAVCLPLNYSEDVDYVVMPLLMEEKYNLD
jgi:hypothetical protein